VSCWALVPVKQRTEGKQRLSSVLSPESRATLVRAMLEHVLMTLTHCRAIDEIAVLSPQHDVLSADVWALPDPGCGLNRALHDGLQTLVRCGAERVAVVTADLPLLNADEVLSLVEASNVTGIALAPDRRRIGTNALCITVPSSFVFRFGDRSLERHRAEAARLGIAPAVLALPGLAFDVDQPEDLAFLSAQTLCPPFHGITPSTPPESR
jgi:2-phospho-L-lactate/phosphoenolpyruvate guanylyltransferase